MGTLGSVWGSVGTLGSVRGSVGTLGSVRGSVGTLGSVRGSAVGNSVGGWGRVLTSSYKSTVYGAWCSGVMGHHRDTGGTDN